MFQLIWTGQSTNNFYGHWLIYDSLWAIIINSEVYIGQIPLIINPGNNLPGLYSQIPEPSNTQLVFALLNLKFNFNFFRCSNYGFDGLHIVNHCGT